jgi:hypothetical protein
MSTPITYVDTTLTLAPEPTNSHLLAPTAGPFQPYAQIFEREGRWLIGPGLLSDIVAYLKYVGGFIAVFRRQELAVELPLPLIRDEITDELAGIYWAIPEELRLIFEDRCQVVINRRAESIYAALCGYLGQGQTSDQFYRINATLAALEDKSESRGWPTVWEIAAEEFGFSSCRLPPRANLCVDLGGRPY